MAIPRASLNPPTASSASIAGQRGSNSVSGSKTGRWPSAGLLLICHSSDLARTSLNALRTLKQLTEVA
jgi:hypothetical protein